MCWRDNQSNDEWLADFRRIQDGYRLRQMPAKIGDKVHIDVEIEKNRRYFRRRTIRFLSGPMDTIEVLFPPGTKVAFDKLPIEVRTRFHLTKENPDAEVVIEGEQTGFVFDSSKEKKYFPLAGRDFPQLTVLSLP